MRKEQRSYQIQTNSQTRIIRSVNKSLPTVQDPQKRSSKKETIKKSMKDVIQKRKSEGNKHLITKINKMRRIENIGRIKGGTKSKQQISGGCINQPCENNIKILQFWMKGDFRNSLKRINRYSIFISKSGLFIFYLIMFFTN